MLDIDSYIMGKKKGGKSTVIDVGSSATIEYDADTKTVTMTVEGGEE